MSQAEVPGAAYWKDITRYSRLIEGRIARSTGHFLLGAVGRKLHKATWQTADSGERAEWFRPEVRCLGLPVDERSMNLILTRGVDRERVTTYWYKPAETDLTVIYQGVGHETDTLRQLEQVHGSKTFAIPGITEADYARLHQELAYGASIPAHRMR